MDEKELEMLDKVWRTANLVNLPDKFVSENVQEMLLCYRIILLLPTQHLILSWPKL